MDIEIKNEAGKVVETVSFETAVLAKTVHKRLLLDAVVYYEANLRQGSANSKDVSEVRGTGAKMYKQKGTGRARAHYRRSPLRVHGGVAHGPKPRSFRKTMPRKARQLATRSALLSKFLDNEVIVIDTLNYSTMEAPKTKRVVETLKNLGLDTTTTLAVALDHEDVFLASANNVQGLEASSLTSLNAYVLLKQKRLLLSKDALDALSNEVVA